MSKDLGGRLRLSCMQRAGKPAVTADRATIEDVYRTRFSRFVRAMTAIVGSPEYARDAVQEGFARALAARQSYRGDGALEAWIWQIALNAARDAHRHTSRESPLEEPLPLELPQTTDDLALRHALRQLPKQQRLLVFLHYLADVSYEEIAAICEISEGAVGASLSKARRTLATLLADADERSRHE